MSAFSGLDSEAPSSLVTQHITMLGHWLALDTQSLGSGVPTAVSEIRLQSLLEGFQVSYEFYTYKSHFISKF